MRTAHINLVCIWSLLTAGCASTIPPAVFVPQPETWIQPIYRNGVPIGIVKGDSAILYVALDLAELSGQTYMRLWLFYKNTSGAEFTLEPLKSLSLSLQREGEVSDPIYPDTPTEVLSHIENEKAVNLIVQAFGGALQSGSAKATTITDPEGKKYSVSDRGEKQLAIQDRTASAMQNTASYYDNFKSSVNMGILRKNTVFPEESVNGYVYFLMPVRNKSAGFRPERYTFSLQVVLPEGLKIITFVPSAGE